MKRVLMAAAAASLLVTPAALAAPSQTTDVTISGSVADTCVMSAPTVTASSNATASALNGNAGTSTIGIDSLATSADDASLAAASFQLTYSDSYCNYAHSIDMASAKGGMVIDTPVAVVGGTFVQMIGYDSTLTWGAASVTDVDSTTSTASNAAPGAVNGTEASVAGAYRGDLILDVSIAADTNPVVSGTYSETLTISLGVAI